MIKYIFFYYLIFLFSLFWFWGETWPWHVLDRLHEIHPERSPAIWHQWQLTQHFINFSLTHLFACLSLTDQTFITITLTSICDMFQSRSQCNSSLWSYQNPVERGDLFTLLYMIGQLIHQLFKFHNNYWF